MLNEANDKLDRSIRNAREQEAIRRDEPAEHPEDCECKWCIVPETEDQ